MLEERTTALKIPLEMKATGQWNPADSNRTVLTSSSAKLRSQFVSPIYHLLVTVIYSQVGGGVRIDAIRVDFLEPTTQVNVRMESSGSHKILDQGGHYSRTI